MRATIAWWDLSDSTQTIGSLRDHLRDEGVEDWRAVPGLRMKLWLSDETGNRWGAVMLWAPGHPVEGQALPPNRAAELIGYPATSRVTFDVETTVEGSA